jgi:hypothetical protein
VTRTASTPPSATRPRRGALAGALEAIGRELDWQLAAFWSADRARDVLRCEQVWHAHGHGLEDFAAASRGLELAGGVGIPGRA